MNTRWQRSKGLGTLFGDETKTNLYYQDQPAFIVSSDDEKAKDYGVAQTNGRKKYIDVEKGDATDNAVT